MGLPLLKLIRQYLPGQCLRQLLKPYYKAIIFMFIGFIPMILNFIIVIPTSYISTMLLLSLFMLVLSWLFYIWFLANLMDKIDFERDTCLMDGNNFGTFMLLVSSYLILSLWGLLNILFYQAFREYGMNTLFTLYSMLFAATLTSTSILFTLGNWVISRRDREDGRLIAIIKATRRALLFIFVVVFLSLLSVADFLVTRQTPFATCFLAISLGLTITMAQTLVIMHALMDTLSELANSKGEARDQGTKEGTENASKPQS
jgi:hypothetical protein